MSVLEDLSTINLREPDGAFGLRLEHISPRDFATGHAPSYHFAIEVDGVRVGAIRLRVGNEPELILYVGHVGYAVDPLFRGHGYARRACQLIMSLARLNGMQVIWITCNPDNFASRRTCERLGATYVDTVDIPATHLMFHEGDTKKCRYRYDL